VVSRIESLADFPESGRVVPEFGMAQLREIIYPPFGIVYRVDEGRVRVVRIWRQRVPWFQDAQFEQDLIFFLSR
jgi:toxin ParE1/3/4